MDGQCVDREAAQAGVGRRPALAAFGALEDATAGAARARVERGGSRGLDDENGDGDREWQAGVYGRPALSPVDALEDATPGCIDRGRRRRVDGQTARTIKVGVDDLPTLPTVRALGDAIAGAS